MPDPTPGTDAHPCPHGNPHAGTCPECNAKPLTFTLSDAAADRDAHARRSRAHARTLRMRRRAP